MYKNRLTKCISINNISFSFTCSSDLASFKNFDLISVLTYHGSTYHGLTYQGLIYHGLTYRGLFIWFALAIFYL